MDLIIKKELHFLAEKSKPFAPVFTSGICKISTEIIMKILAFSTTYVIAMLQFNVKH